MTDNLQKYLSVLYERDSANKRVEVLTEALAKLSNELIAAGNTEPQMWHSDNEKRAFVVMKRMGEDGLLAISRSLME